MKSKILKLTMLFSLTGAIISGCNSNNSNNESADSTANRDEMSQGMGTVQTDSIETDSAHQHHEMHGDTVR